MSYPDSDARNKDRIGGLVKGLRLIEAFDAAHTRMTVAEAARRVEISPASARRCLLTLCELGYAQTDGKLFWLGHGALRVAYAYSASTRLPRLLQPALDAMSERSRESASLAVLGDDACVIAARSTARRSLLLGLGVGSRLPLHCSASGRVLLAALPARQAEQLLRRLPCERLTPRTVVEPRALRALLVACRGDGYAVCDEEIETGVRSMAVPIVNRGGETLAAMTISTRSDRMTVGEMRSQYLPALLRHQAWARERLA